MSIDYNLGGRLIPLKLGSKQQVDQGAAGPATAGQLARQGGVARVDAARVGMRQLRCAPQRWVQCLWCGKDGRRVHGSDNNASTV